MRSKTGIILLAAVLFSTALLLNGCSAPCAEQQVRSQLYSLLDDGAMTVSVSDKSAFNWKYRKIERDLANQLENAENPAERRHFAAALSLFKLFKALCGAESVLGTGYSALVTAEENIHEKSVLLYEPENAGLLKNFLNPQNTLDVRALTEDIPERAAAVFVADIQVKELLRALDMSGGFPEVLASIIPNGFPVAEFVRGIDGIWQMTLLQADEKNTVVKLDIPDKDSHIFKMFSTAMRINDVNQRIFIPGMGTFIRKENRLIFYIGNSTEEIFKAAEKNKLAGNKARLLTKMPDKAVMFAFVNPRRISEDLKKICSDDLSFPVFDAADEPLSIAVSRLAEANGYVASANGSGKVLSMDIDLFSDIILPLFSDLLPDKKESAPAKMPKKHNAVHKECSCTRVLAAAGKSLAADPQLTAGFYRVEEGKLLKASAEKFDVVLLKTKTPSRSLPMLVAPAHKESFCVCGPDGKISRYQLVKPDSFLRIAGFLHTVYKFDEKVFRELVTLAGELDRKQGSENGIQKCFNKELRDAVEKCSDNLSFEDISRLNGIRLELLRRYIDRQAKNIRTETWDKIYPLLKPYLEGPEPIKEPPPRLGAPYRRHAELVDMLSEQKVLLDEFAIFSDREKKQIIKKFASVLDTPAKPTEFESLSNIENELMGNFLAMSKEVQSDMLAELTAQATIEARRQRAELF